MFEASTHGRHAEQRQALAEDAPARRLSRRDIEAFWRYIWLRLRHPNLRVGFFFLDRGADMHIARTAHVRLGRGVRIARDFTAHFHGNVSIGDNVFFNRDCHVVAFSSVTIGDNCLFGERVSIHDENHVLTPVEKPVASRGFVTEAIVVGSNVWVGANATILAGAHIGDNAVIGANAVVTHDIPARSVAVGIPARVVRTIS